MSVWHRLRRQLGRIIDQLGQDDYFGLVTFNDRADVLISAQRVTNRADLKQSFNRIEAAGDENGTTGIAHSAPKSSAMLIRGINRLMILTDGRTYGDESACVDIARRAQGRGIGITALGIGTEWNEDLLETMTANENSHTAYIQNPQEVSAVFCK